MEANRRQTGVDLSHLVSTYRKYDFMQYVRVLDQQGCQHRFATMLAGSYASHSISRVTQHNDYIKIHISFNTLAGQSGVLPEYFNELLFKRVQLKDSALLELMDIFNHRLTLKYIQNYKQQHFMQANDSPTTALLSALSGFSSLGSQRGTTDQLLRYAGFLNNKVKSKTALQSALSEQFGLPVSINEYVWKWVALGDSTTRLTRWTNRLGVNTTLGKRAWQLTGLFEIEFSRVDYSTFTQFLPTKPLKKAIETMVDLLKPALMNYQLKVVINPNQVPTAQLGSKQFHLGWNSWLKSAKPNNKFNQIVLK